MTTIEQPMAENLTRPSVEAMDSILGHAIPVLDHGHVRVIDYMGDEAAIVQAARVSYGAGTKTPSDDRSLIRYLLRRWHTTPFEMCSLKLHVKLPIFVARQWVRHRTAKINEYSARYSIMSREFHIPEISELAKQSTGNKQGRDEGIDDLSAEEIQAILLHDANRAFDSYEEMVDDDGLGLARELARINLPLSTYTEWYWKIDLHNLLHFLRLRADPHAQKEIRVYAEVICNIVETWLPNVWEAFVDYQMEAVTFSRIEVRALLAILGSDPLTDVEGHLSALDGCGALEGLSRREVGEFRAKILGLIHN